MPLAPEQEQLLVKYFEHRYNNVSGKPMELNYKDRIVSHSLYSDFQLLEPWGSKFGLTPKGIKYIHNKASLILVNELYNQLDKIKKHFIGLGINNWTAFDELNSGILANIPKHRLEVLCLDLVDDGFLEKRERNLRLRPTL